MYLQNISKSPTMDALRRLLTNQITLYMVTELIKFNPRNPQIAYAENIFRLNTFVLSLARLI